MTAETLQARASRLMGEVPLIDGHNDLPWELRDRYNYQIYNVAKYNFREERLPQSHETRQLALETDLLKLKRGKVGGQFWSVFVECMPEDKDWNNDHGAVRDTLEQIDVIKRLIEEHDEVCGTLCWKVELTIFSLNTARHRQLS